MQKRRKIILAILVIVPLAALGGFTLWAYTPLGPMPEAISALQSDARIQVSLGSWIAFQPSVTDKSTGFIIYPGARVDPRSYAPMAKDIAEEGYLVVIVSMPFNLAVFGVEIASDVMRAYPQINSWAIGGHSLGGSMAASFAYRHPGAVKGIVLWASYPSASENLSSQPIKAVSIYGTRDGLTSVSEINASRGLLPPDAVFVEIVGGNHAQFGWYGPQSGDNEATISREEQQAQAVAATLSILRSIG